MSIYIYTFESVILVLESQLENVEIKSVVVDNIHGYDVDTFKNDTFQSVTFRYS